MVDEKILKKITPQIETLFEEIIRENEQWIVNGSEKIVHTVVMSLVNEMAKRAQKSIENNEITWSKTAEPTDVIMFTLDSFVISSLIIKEEKRLYDRQVMRERYINKK